MQIQYYLQQQHNRAKVSVRALYRPKYFHGGLFTPGLHWTAPPCRNPLTAYLPLGQILCRARPRPARPPCTAGLVSSAWRTPPSQGRKERKCGKSSKNLLKP